MEANRRFLQFPEGSFFLLGPRGTGKTTWLRQNLPEALTVNLLEPATFRQMSARPERLAELVHGNPDRRDVVLDEVQRVPELLHVVHDLIEQPGQNRRFILTGSSARKLRRGGVDLLGGRAAMRTMHPFMAAEWPAFKLEDALVQGLVPLVVSAVNPTDTLNAYAGLYVQQEVMAEGLVRQSGMFARFLETVSFSHASVINISNVAREAAVGRRVVENYLDVLEDLLVSFRIPVFTRRAKRDTTTHPKFYFFDTGIFHSIRPRGPLDKPEEIAGAALEGLVAQHLRAWIAYSGRDVTLHYWRTRSGVEVDFVGYGESDFWAIEVKHSAQVRSADVKSLQTFVADYPECKAMLLYRGTERLKVGGITCWPVEDFLTRLRPGDDVIPSE